MELHKQEPDIFDIYFPLYMRVIDAINA